MWKDSYLVGVELIDNQHKRLFEAITSLKDNLGNLEETHYKEQLRETIAFLKDYCITHFIDEQNYMQSIGFKGYDEHKEKHDKLLGDVGEYEKKLLETDFGHEVVECFLGFLATWIIYHIGVEDQQIPKKERADSTAQKSDRIYDDYANTVKSILSTLAGLSEQEICCDFDNNKHLDTGICYSLKLINMSNPCSIDIVFSNSLAQGLVKEMTGIDAARFVNVMYMTLQEVSGFIGAKIAELMSRETGSYVIIGVPEHVQLSDINNTTDGLIVHAELGEMEVFLN